MESQSAISRSRVSTGIPISKSESLSATHSVALLPAANIFRDPSPIHSLRDFFCSTGIVLGKAGNGSASGLVNNAVTAQSQLTKSLAHGFPALPGIV